MRARRAEGASADTSRSRDERTTTGGVTTDDTFATRLAGRSARFGSDEDAGTGQPDDRWRRPVGERKERQSRVARNAAFARWTEAVTATADDTESQTKRARKRAGRAVRRGAAAAVSDITTAGFRVEAPETTAAAPRESAALATGGGAEHDPSAETVRHARSQGSRYRAARRAERFGTEDADRETGGGMCGSAEMQREPASDRNVTSYPGDESLRRSYPGDEGDSNKKLQIDAGERRTVPAGHGFKTTATIGVAVDDAERNDAESERRQLERAAEQPSAKRRPTPAVTDDVARRRKRALTHDRGRNVLGSRQRQRWVQQLGELGELPKGAQRAEAIKALGA